MSTVEFDRIADVYDDTRRALDEETLNGVVEMLTEHGCRSVLEIGVGTGRVSLPLIRRGYEITGVDISKRMMEKARAKGVGNLVLADGSRMPFRDKSFDATLMAHVFHLLEDPMVVMREAARVSNVGVFALVRKGAGSRPWFSFYGGGRPPSTHNDNGDYDEAAKRLLEERQDRFRKIAEKYHWNWGPSQRLHNWRREQELLESNPPDDLKIVSDVIVNETLEDRIARFEKGGYGFMSGMPDGMREEIIKEMRANASSLQRWMRQQPRHEVYQVALWLSKSLLPADNL